MHQSSPVSSYPSSIASSASRHSGQSYSPSPQAYAFTPPALLHQSSSLSTSSINYQPRHPLPTANARAVIIGINYFTQKGELSPSTSPSPTSTGPNPCRDARNLYTYLIQAKHYAPENIILLTDDQNGVYGQPTRKNILNAMNWIGEKAGINTNDTSPDHKCKGHADRTQEKVLIYYSGHGRVSTQGKSKSSNASAAAPKKPKQSRHSPTHPGNTNHHNPDSNSSNNSTGQESDGAGMETIYPVDFRSFPKGQITPEEIEEKIRPAKRRGVKMTVVFDAYTGVR